MDLYHFGCLLARRDYSELKISREKYAEINMSSRKNSFMHDHKRYQGMGVTEANEAFYQNIGKSRIDSKCKIYEKFSNYLRYVLDHDEFAQKELKKYKREVKRRYDADKAANLTVWRMLCYKCPNFILPYLDSKTQTLCDMPQELFYEEEMNHHAPYHTDAYCARQQKAALHNYDLNMAFFDSLDKEKFDKEISMFLAQHPNYQEISDLKECRGKPGVYILILDEYKQVYIGITSKGIMERIQKHWQNSSKKTLDRLIWGGETTSIISIDSFGPLDTTRILAYKAVEKDVDLIESGTSLDEFLRLEESRLIKSAFSPDFILNRCMGGLESLLESALMSRQRKLQ